MLATVPAKEDGVGLGVQSPAVGGVEEVDGKRVTWQQGSELPGPTAVGCGVEEILRVAARILVGAVQYQRTVLAVPEAQALDRAIAGGRTLLRNSQGNPRPVPASITRHVQEVSAACPAATLDPTRGGTHEDEVRFRAGQWQMARQAACVRFGELAPARAAVGRPVDGHHVRTGGLQRAILLHQEPAVLPVDEVDRAGEAPAGHGRPRTRPVPAAVRGSVDLDAEITR